MIEWKVIDNTSCITEEDLIITENDVIRSIQSALQERGHTIERVALTHQRGIDLLTSKDGNKFVFECKGTKTDLHAGNIFNATQNEVHFSGAIIQALRRCSEVGNAVYSVAFPVHNNFFRIVDQMGVFVHRLPVNIIFVGKKCIYEIRNDGAIAS